MSAGFLREELAMFINSSVVAKQIFGTAYFEVGIGYLLHTEAKDSIGVAIGGASVWITKNKTQAEVDGAWDFMKYTITPKIQEKWHLDMSYFQ
ncbi:extracellular solute-binding protein [Vagococcus vulneris]|uniref:Uncharacterized protein n=1 Tax=Vagococcus vulneris TaxID=1977869 RepID=A0A429ZWP1_9ENTE|nr:extracellular solute-binding protein [Vagococcus vulneris]RST98208.1 hypothetical protein CBF37_08545 [Vagococcus vulneris]